jgi:hypothetical protein
LQTVILIAEATAAAMSRVNLYMSSQRRTARTWFGRAVNRRAATVNTGFYGSNQSYSSASRATPPGRSDPSHATPNFHAVRTLARVDSMVPAQYASADPARPEGRDAKGRFATGNSGRPKGARSRLISELEQAMALAAPEIVRILIGRAQCGDGSMEAAKYILERVAPSRRGRLVEIEGFEVRTPADVPSALASLATAVGDGTITIEEATAVGSLLQTFLDTYETAHRLAKSLPPGDDCSP